ncbi:unnamed protein product [Allacma fusca]|uniref:Uncharacterized protein n=1 Tax=Allacma fusca TaxID=39272 RepID=A0A8J2PAC9_9HEXA|nr:unnamed protein product [Allacma fusca]
MQNNIYEPDGSGKRHPEEFLEDFFSCIGLKLFIKTLNFSGQKPMLRFFRHYEKFFDVFKYVPGFPDFGKQLINSLEFTEMFRKFTKFGLDVVRGEYTEVEKSWGPHYNKCAIYVITSWCLLFNMDYNFYVTTFHGTILEKNIQIWFEGLEASLRKTGPYKINGALNILEEFNEKCKSNGRPLKWVEILLLVSTY